jgi:hypothetical protein
MITCVRIASLVLGLSCFVVILHSQEKHQQKPLQHVSVVHPSKTFLNTNNISTVLWNNGWADTDTTDANSGFVFPKGTRKTAVFKSGLLWGGKVGNQIRVGGSSYWTGLHPGKIISPGVAEDPNLPLNRIYRVRPDYLNGDLTSEMLDEHRSESEIRTRYARDWEEWPAERGAPFDDRNNNGTYDPSLDVPGVKGASQTIWFVCNDLDSLLTTGLYGSPPMGIEMQVTIWGYAAAGPMGDLFFKSYVLINKSTSPIDSMYVCQWSDPDVGDSNDDFAGCDTTLSIGFAFNAYQRDATYYPLPPPAVGFKLAQGPLVPSPGGVGRSRGMTFQDTRNLPMSVFFYCVRSDFQISSCGEQGSYNGGTLFFYNLFKGLIGRTGQVFTDPQGRQTRFMLDGDPVSGTGWVDGLLFPPGDRRIGICSGSFTMAPGDTQEIVVAEVAGLGEDRLSSVTRMKNNARIAQAAYDSYFRTLPPYPSVKANFISQQSTRITLNADAKGTTASSMNATLKKYEGSIVATSPLFDDGLHDDGAVGDRVYGNTMTIAPLAEGMYADLDVVYSEGYTATWPRIADEISTAGPVEVSRYAIVSDNINSDGIVQPGENIRLGVTVRNGSQFGFSNIGVVGPNGEYFRKITLGALPSQGSVSTVYVPTDPTTYFVFDVPSDYAGREFLVPLAITDSAHNRWADTLIIPVLPLPFPIRNTPLVHVSGRGDGAFDISVVDLSRVRSHTYVIQVVDSVDSAGSAGITLRDSTNGTVLLLNHILPDTLGHLVPVTDGFKILRGSIETSSGMKDWQIPHGSRRWTWVDAAELGLDGFEGAIGWESPNHYFFGGPIVVPAHQVKDILVKFAAATSSVNGNPNNTSLKYGGWNENTVADTLFSYGYRYLRNALAPPAVPEFAPYIVNRSVGWPYQDYKKGVPFSAYDIEENHPRRLAVGFLENNQRYGLVDGKLWPPPSAAGITNTQSDGPREWFFIFNTPYTGQTPDTSLQRDLLNNPLPVMWMGTVNRRGGANYFAGDEFLIRARHPITSQDRYVFSLDSIMQNFVPAGFQLRQNYPNPFNPNTTIAYDLPVTSRVVIKIYNVLGQHVKTLLDENQQLGFNSTVWDATNNQRNQVSTGVYFYRIEASSLADPSRSFTQVKKMMVLR